MDGGKAQRGGLEEETEQTVRQKRRLAGMPMLSFVLARLPPSNLGVMMAVSTEIHPTPSRNLVCEDHPILM